MANKLPIDTELQTLGVTFANAALPEIAPALLQVGYTAERQAADYALWERLQAQRFEQLLAMGMKKELTDKVTALRDEVFEDLRSVRNVLKGVQRFHPAHNLLVRTGLEKATARSNQGQLLSKAGAAYHALLEQPELAAIAAEHGLSAARLQALLDKVEALHLLDREQEGGKGVAQDATSDFYAQLKQLRAARASLKALALVAFGPDDVQYLETLALGPVRMRVGVAKTAPR